MGSLASGGLLGEPGDFERWSGLTIDQRQEEIVRRFDRLGDPMSRYRFLINLARRAPGLADHERNERTLLHGCTAQAWLLCRGENGRMSFRADSPSLIVKGLGALLASVLSGNTAADIVSAELSFIERTGLARQVSPGRSNGLAAMLKRMRGCALEMATQARGG